MARPRRKLSRKQLKQPGGVEQLAADLSQFLADNLRQLVLALALVTVVAAAAWALYAYHRHRDVVAAQRFYQAFSALQNRQFKTARIGFGKLAAAEPNRELGRLARFYLASTYLAENDLPRARDALVAYLAEAHEPAFLELAAMDLGVVYERLGELTKAQGAYRQAASLPGPQSINAELSAARILEQQGKRAGAVAAYRHFLALHPFAQERQDVIERLARLGAAPQPPVTAPRAPPAQPSGRPRAS